MKYHHFWQAVRDGDVKVSKIKTTLQNADFLTKGLPQETFQANRHRVQGWATSPNMALVPLAPRKHNGKPSADPTHERESQDSDQLIHKSAPPQFTARDGKTDRSLNPDLVGPQILQLMAESPQGLIAQPRMVKQNAQNPAMTTWSVPGTTKDEVERKDPKDQGRGTSNEVV